jgi:hypothetical protein
MPRIVLCLVLCLAVPALALAQQGAGNNKTSIEKSDKRANAGGKASQQRGGNSSAPQSTSPTAPASTPATKPQP